MNEFICQQKNVKRRFHYLVFLVLLLKSRGAFKSLVAIKKDPVANFQGGVACRFQLLEVLRFCNVKLSVKPLSVVNIT